MKKRLRRYTNILKTVALGTKGWILLCLGLNYLLHRDEPFTLTFVYVGVMLFEISPVDFVRRWRRAIILSIK